MKAIDESASRFPPKLTSLVPLIDVILKRDVLGTSITTHAFKSIKHRDRS